jgi:DNA-binding FrmR family transcriptional regulator
MAHTQHDKKLLNRVRRLRGQVDAVAKAIEEGQECALVLQTLAACRGAINALLAEIIEGHIDHHLSDAKGRLQRDAAEELMGVVRAYLK